MCGSSGGTCVWREVEQDDRNLALRNFPATHLDECRDFAGQTCRALGATLHRPNIVGDGKFAVAVTSGTALWRTIRTATEHARDNCTIQFRDRHHHGRFKRQQAQLTSAPLFERLELDRVRSDIWHVHTGQRFDGRIDVIISRPADQREARQIDNGIDRWLTFVHKISIDGGA